MVGMRLCGAQGMAIRAAFTSIAESVSVFWIKIESGKTETGSMNVPMGCGLWLLSLITGVALCGTRSSQV